MKRKLQYPVKDDRFGEWVVLTGEVIKIGPVNHMRCRCSCGVEQDVRVRALVQGLSHQCHNHRMNIRVGDQFGEWTVLEEVGRSENNKKQRMFNCRCSCGNERKLSAHGLLYGGTTRCASCRSVKHGHVVGGKPSSEYRAWRSMLHRCDEPKARAYANYGGRGIFYDPSWKDFEVFLGDMGLKPSPELTLDRKDNDGPYNKANCRWATRKQQANNRRKNRCIEFEGRRMSITDWAVEKGIHVRTLQYRMNQNWPLDKVFGDKFCHYQEGEPVEAVVYATHKMTNKTQRKVVYERDGGVCQVCGDVLTFADFQLGHIVDRAAGGNEELENLVLMCKPCNRRKPTHHTVAEYEEWKQDPDIRLVYEGREQTMAAWAAEYNIREGTLKIRLRRGWTLERALTTKAIPRSITKRAEGPRDLNVGRSKSISESWGDRSDVHLLTHDGRSQSIAAWARELDIPHGVIRQRLRLGWSTERTLTEPVIETRREITWKDKTQSVANWSSETEISVASINYRLRQGWSVEKTLTTSRRKGGRFS